jgi:hypothetical protein
MTYVDNRKLSKRRVLTVVSGQKGQSSRGTDGDIYTERQYFRMMHKHLKGSTRPVGHFHKGYGSDRQVEIRWLWTEKLGYFAPELSYQVSKDSIAIAKTIGEALREMNEKLGPEGLIERAQACVVEYIDDNKEGCWDDYRCVRMPGDSEMMIIARAAMGD